MNKMLLDRCALAMISAGGGIAAGSAVHSSQFLYGPIGLLCIALAFTRTKTASMAAMVGWIGGFGYFAAALPFLLTGYAAIGISGLQPIIGVIALYLLLSVWWPIAFALSHRLAKGPLALSIFWGCAELLRSQVFPAIPVAQLASVLSQTPLAQLSNALSVELLGSLMLTLCVVAAFDLAKLRMPWASLGLSLVLAYLASGYRDRPMPAPELPLIAAIDTAIPQNQRWNDELLPDYIANLTARSQSAFAAGADLVIWPEVSVPYFPTELKEALGGARPPAGSFLALGLMTPVEEEPGRFKNSFIVLDSELNEVARYDKRHLFPFGEYIPFAEQLEQWLGLSTIAASSNAIAQGDTEALIRLPGLPGTLIPQICYEGSFAVSRALLRDVEGAYIVNVSNDAWWAGSRGARFVEQEARLRAIEAGLPLIRVPNMRKAAIFDAKGDRQAN